MDKCSGEPQDTRAFVRALEIALTPDHQSYKPLSQKSTEFQILSSGGGMYRWLRGSVRSASRSPRASSDTTRTTRTPGRHSRRAQQARPRARRRAQRPSRSERGASASAVSSSKVSKVSREFPQSAKRGNDGVSEDAATRHRSSPLDRDS